MEKARTRGVRDMTAGSPAGHIFAFSLPLMAGSLFQLLYNTVDSWVVGRYVGDGALAAVGVGFPVITMFTSMFIGLSNGGTVVIAQFFGAGKRQRVRDAIDTIYTAFAAAIPLTLAAAVLMKPMLFLLRVEASAYDEAWIYLTTLCVGLTGSIGYNLNAGILGGLGNSRTTLLFLAAAAGMNIALDLTLVLACGLGVFGVALGTIVSQAFSWLFGIFYINRRYPELAIHPFCRRFDRDLFREILRIGLPAGIQMSLVAVGIMSVLSKAGSYGKEFTAGYNVGNKLDQLAFLPVQSLTSAITAFVGQNVGAKRLDRVREGVRVTLLAAVVWSLLMAALLMPLAPLLVGCFSDTPATVHAGAVYIRCIMPFYAVFAVFFCLNGAMRGAGDSVFPMLNVVFSLILLRVPVVYLLANLFGPDFMYYGFGAGWILGFALSVFWYLSGHWLRRGSIAGSAKPNGQA